MGYALAGPATHEPDGSSRKTPPTPTPPKGSAGFIHEKHLTSTHTIISSTFFVVIRSTYQRNVLELYVCFQFCFAAPSNTFNTSQLKQDMQQKRSFSFALQKVNKPVSSQSQSENNRLETGRMCGFLTRPSTQTDGDHISLAGHTAGNWEVHRFFIRGLRTSCSHVFRILPNEPLQNNTIWL